MAFQTTIDELLRRPQKTHNSIESDVSEMLCHKHLKTGQRYLIARRSCGVRLGYSISRWSVIDWMRRMWSAQVVAAHGILKMYIDRKTKTKTNPTRRKVVLHRYRRSRHLVAECYATRHKDGTVLKEAAMPDMQTPAQKPQQKTDGGPQQSNDFSKLCYRCRAEGHLARNCTTAPTIPHAHIPDARTSTGYNSGKDSLATYAMEVGDRKCSVKTVIPKARELVEVSIDEHVLMKDEDDIVMPLPLYHLLAQEYVEKEVFVVPKLSAKEVKKSTGCL